MFVVIWFFFGLVLVFLITVLKRGIGLKGIKIKAICKTNSLLL